MAPQPPVRVATVVAVSAGPVVSVVLALVALSGQRPVAVSKSWFRWRSRYRQHVAGCVNQEFGARGGRGAMTTSRQLHRPPDYVRPVQHQSTTRLSTSVSTSTTWRPERTLLCKSCAELHMRCSLGAPGRMRYSGRFS